MKVGSVSPEPMFLTSAPHCTIGASRHHQPRLGAVGGGQPGRFEISKQWPGNKPFSSLLQSLSVSPEPCLSLGSPPLLPRPSCQRLQPQPQWGCWGHHAESLSSSEDQGSSPACRLPVPSPTPGSGLQLSSCPELWQEDLEGPPLNIFY